MAGSRAGQQIHYANELIDRQDLLIHTYEEAQSSKLPPSAERLKNEAGTYSRLIVGNVEYYYIFSLILLSIVGSISSWQGRKNPNN